MILHLYAPQSSTSRANPFTPYKKKIYFQQFAKALLKIAVNRGMGLPFTKNIH